MPRLSVPNVAKPAKACHRWLLAMIPRQRGALSKAPIANEYKQQCKGLSSKSGLGYFVMLPLRATIQCRTLGDRRLDHTDDELDLCRREVEVWGQTDSVVPTMDEVDASLAELGLQTTLSADHWEVLVDVEAAHQTCASDMGADARVLRAQALKRGDELSAGCHNVLPDIVCHHVEHGCAHLERTWVTGHRVAIGADGVDALGSLAQSQERQWVLARVKSL